MAGRGVSQTSLSRASCKLALLSSQTKRMRSGSFFQRPLSYCRERKLDINNNNNKVTQAIALVPFLQRPTPGCYLGQRGETVSETERVEGGKYGREGRRAVCCHHTVRGDWHLSGDALLLLGSHRMPGDMRYE